MKRSTFLVFGLSLLLGSGSALAQDAYAPSSLTHSSGLNTTPQLTMGLMAQNGTKGVAGGSFGANIPALTSATPTQAPAPVAPAMIAPAPVAPMVTPVQTAPLNANDLQPQLQPDMAVPTPMMVDATQQGTPAVPLWEGQTMAVAPAPVMAAPSSMEPQVIEVPVPVYQPVYAQPAPAPMAAAAPETLTPVPEMERQVQDIPSPAFTPSARTTESTNPVPYENIPPQPGLVFELDQIDNVGSETLVTRKISEMGSDLKDLQNAVGLAKQQLENIRFSTEIQSADYYSIVAAVQSRLQAGSTPGNPRLVNSWNIAQDRLDRMSENVGSLNDLATRVAEQANMASFLLEAARATYGLSGALESDHAELQILEDDITGTVVVINRFLNEITDDINRRTAHLTSERKNLQSLAVGITNGDLYGRSITNQYFRRVTDPISPNGLERLEAEGKRPLAIIRFNQANVKYQQPVYAAVNEAIERNPDAEFELIAVAPNDGTPAEVAMSSTEARQKAEGVVRTLSNMGLPTTKMLVSSSQSADADSAEVHIYVR